MFSQLMPSADDGATGAQLVGATLQSRYRLNRLIGKGGMGAVYEAVQVPLGKRVAVKIMARELAANEEALARFRREAEVTSQLGHPHIVQVFDFGETATGEPYLVMEYLEGEDLERRLARTGRCSLAVAVKVVTQVASALAATHARGIVHRDLKPGNVFLQRVEGEDDFVKVVDFGISKVHMATTRLTGEKVVLGTPSYMSPEQANGRVDDIDGRTDEWSLACIAYEMLAGHPPFRGDDASAVIYQIIYRRAQALTELVPALPSGVDHVLGRALSKAQADRFPTVPAFARALEAVAAGRSIPADEVTPAVEPGAGEPLAQPSGGGATTTFSHTAAEATGPSRGLVRAPIGVYVVTVAAAAAAALALLSLRAHRTVATPAQALGPPAPARAAAAPPAPPLVASDATPADGETSPTEQAPPAATLPETSRAAAPSSQPSPSTARPAPVAPAERRTSRPRLHLIQDL